MLKVGITGGIGAGKSLVCKIFENIGISHYNADIRAKELIEEDPELIQGIKSLFGEESYLPTGKYNRSFVGQAVFSDSEKLNKLNGLVHPAVHRDADKWFEQSEGPYALYEAALIIEANRQNDFDALILVSAPEELRIERVMKRNKISREAVKKRLDAQSTDLEKRKHCQFEILNDQQHFLIPQVQSIHQILTSRK